MGGSWTEGQQKCWKLDLYVGIFWTFSLITQSLWKFKIIDLKVLGSISSINKIEWFGLYGPHSNEKNKGLMGFDQVTNCITKWNHRVRLY